VRNGRKEIVPPVLVFVDMKTPTFSLGMSDRLEWNHCVSPPCPMMRRPCDDCS
jgi:hypothetical protein